MDISFVAGFGPIGTADEASVDVLVRRARQGVRDLAALAGRRGDIRQPGVAGRPAPRTWVEFDVASPAAVAEILMY